MSANPYAPLSQKYEQCTYDVFQTAVNQAGIAIGNIQIVAPILIILLMLISMWHKSYNKVPLDESYSKAAKDSALDAYAMSLLLARDQRLKTVSFHNNNSIIALIAEELGEHTMLSAVSHKQHKQEHHSSSHLSIHSMGSPRIMAKIASLNRLTHLSHHSVSPYDELAQTPLSLENVPHTSGSATKYMTYDEEQQHAQNYQQVRQKTPPTESPGGGQGLSVLHIPGQNHLDPRKSAVIDAAYLKATMDVIDFETGSPVAMESDVSSRRQKGRY